MKRTLTYLIFGILLPLFSSCIFDEVIETENVSKDLTVTFTLKVDSQPVSKSVSAIDTDTDFENRIDMSSLLVFAYDASGAFIEQLPILYRSENGAEVMELTCGLKNPYDNRTVKLVVLANCVSDAYRLGYSGNIPLLDNLKYVPPTSSSYGLIPMMGMTRYDLQFNADGSVVKTQQLEDPIELLRSMAKVGVALSDDLISQGYSIVYQDLKLNYARSTGYSLPKSWATYNYTGSLVTDVENEEEREGRLYRPTESEHEINFNINPISVSDDGYYCLYVPETENGAAILGEPTELSLALTVQRTDPRTRNTKEYEFDFESGIKFREYVGGAAGEDTYNIVRNHFYKFLVTSIEAGLGLNLYVEDWVDTPVWELDFSAPIHTKLLTAPDPAAEAPTAVPTVRYDSNDPEAGAFVGYFMMESPEGMTWRPTLASASTTDYDVLVYTTDGVNDEYDVLVTDDAIEAELNKFYKIVVVAKNQNNVGNVIKLGLTYTIEWNAEVTPLLIINKGDEGDEDGCYYPWDGTVQADKPDIHWISIRQI